MPPAFNSEMTSNTALETWRKVLAETELVTVSSLFGFVSHPLLIYLKFDYVISLGKQLPAIVQHIDSDISEELKADLVKEMDGVLMGSQVLYSFEPVKVDTSSFAHKLWISTPTSEKLVPVSRKENHRH